MCSRAREGHAPPDEGGAHQGALRQTKEESPRLHRRDDTAVDNLVNSDCRAEESDVLWLTDTTEFAAVDGKACLSPMVDCFDGIVVSWSTSRHPDSDLVPGMLEGAVDTPGVGKRASLKREDGCNCGSGRRVGPGRDPGGDPNVRAGGRERESALLSPVIMCLTSGLGAAAPSVLGIQPNSRGLAVLPPASCMATAGASLLAISWCPWHRLRRALCARRSSAPQTGHWGGARRCAPPRLRAL